MYKEVFVRDFSTLGTTVSNILTELDNNNLLNSAFEKSASLNPLFTLEMQKEALRAICLKFLKKDCLNNWLMPYTAGLREMNTKVGVIMAGNLPLVGFHDFLTVMASGCVAEIKLSGKDSFLLPALFEILCQINPYWRERVIFTTKLPENIDLLIATGSEESVGMFESRYCNVRKIVRGSRSSIAVLRGDENMEELRNLSCDIFLYFGMGCRSVSTLLVPAGYKFEKLLEALSHKAKSMENKDYMDAYRYQKAMAQMANVWYIDGGFYILRKFNGFSPPISVVNIFTYISERQVEEFIESNKQHLQCVISRDRIMFGEAQYPAVDEYADGVNSLDFILNNS